MVLLWNSCPPNTDRSLHYPQIRVAVDRWTCAQRLSHTVLNESVPPVSRWPSSGIAVLQIADRSLHYPQVRIVQSYVGYLYEL
ncbi:hypothetical protein AYI69_g658 [Smittium culicis]|uniref:Uncharacterized protein n=1 Tax=Smittium culicis TaxID=133412 RepID=A0A1R1YSH5_9FUNG|nr:hypothetical protein AYI69_g658 [Smittium culicis]